MLQASPEKTAESDEAFRNDTTLAQLGTEFGQSQATASFDH
jgi:hypothetical protein